MDEGKVRKAYLDCTRPDVSDVPPGSWVVYCRACGWRGEPTLAYPPLCPGCGLQSLRIWGVERICRHCGQPEIEHGFNKGCMRGFEPEPS